MKRKLSIAIIILIGAVSYFYFEGIRITTRESAEGQTKHFTISAIPENESSKDEGKRENPIERLEFEAAQLRDPETGKIPNGIRQREIAYAEQSLNIVTPEAYDPRVAVSAATGTNAAAPFRNVGPFNIGGKTRAVGLDKDDENIILAGGTASGVWKTADQGATWTRTTGLQQQPAVTSIIQDRRDGNTDTWYYGGGENSGNSASDIGAFYFGNGIYKSIDNGDSWSLIAATAAPGTSDTDVVTEVGDFSLVDELAIDYSNASGTEIYAAGANQIIRSVDGFETYDIVLGSTNTGSSNQCDVAVTSAGKVFAVITTRNNNGSQAQNGLFESEDGITWTELDLEGLDNSYARMEIAINPSNENQIYFLTEDQLISYNDATNTATDLTGSIEVSTNSIDGYTSQGGYNVEIGFHPGDDAIVFLGGTNLLRSTNGFGTVGTNKHIGGYEKGQVANYPNHHPDIHKLFFFDSDPNVMLTGTDGGVHLTRDNTTPGSSTSNVSVNWESLNNGYLTTQFHHASIHNYSFGDVQIIGGMQDNGTYASFSGEEEEDWVEVTGGDGTYTGLTYNSAYSSLQEGRLFRFELDGSTYGSFDVITPGDFNTSFGFVNPFNYNPVHQDQIFVAGRGRIFVTNDVRPDPSGDEWVELEGPAAMANQFVSALTTSTDSEGVLYLGTRSGALFKIADTRDISTSTEVLTLERGNMPNGNISSIAVDPNDAERVFVTFSNYNVVSLWMSADGGGTWSSISGNLEENTDGSGAGPSLRGIEVMPDGSGGNYYFAATSVGLFMTKELKGEETNWEQQAADVLGNIVIQNIRVRPIDGVVMASTHASGVYLGSYDVGVNANINYSINADGTEYLLRANPSFIDPSPFTYQWIKDGQNIDGETGETFTVTDGGSYQVRLDMSGEEAAGLSNTVVINLDGTGPDVSAITRLNPTDQTTDLTTVQFQVTFSETVLNVSADDFEITSAASGVIGTVTESTIGTVFDVTVNSIDGIGELNLDIASSNNITDESGNAFSGTVLAEETYTIVDSTEPDVTAITRLNPTDQTTDLTTVQFQVAFSEAVLNVSADDFEITGDASGVIGTVTESTTGTVFDVTVNSIEGEGELNLDIAVSNNITDESGNAFSGTVLTEETYTITDSSGPTATITRGTPLTELTDQNEVTFLVTFTEDVDNVDVTDFALAIGSPTATLSSVTEVFIATTFEVVVTDIFADGTLGLDFVSGQDIANQAGDAFDGTVTTDETYTIENVITAIDDPLARRTQQIIADANPSSGIFNLAFPPAFIGDFEMQVVDVQGRSVLLRGIKNYNTGDQIALDLTKSPDGVYILRASNGQTRASIKLLKRVGSR